ncbi:FxLYD domain-containing protein [Pseudoalteromonas byunsanensis]|uniref:ATPase n=1 Tax=Pseudoalteromonas byunsanensis TaxID=327939 RepID=A0A1S1N6K4_9GAMM|nr:FxLYD domain-containing protein [Pseudoalteromonas byunsanensis]OHU94962.1 ATPase [Pseudoalteromonas byunsanensis]
MPSKSFEEVLKGFFWGLGFSLSVISIGTVYTLNMAAHVDKGFKESLQLKVMNSINELTPSYEVSLSEIFKENGRVKITAELKNTSSEELYAVEVIASTFDSNGKFIGNCTGKGNEITLAPKEISYVEIDCDFFRLQSEKVHSAKVKIKWI